MARNTRGGLGRGLSSLMGGASDGGTPAQRTSNRERVVYDEREELYSTGEINIPPNRKPQNTINNPSNVSRETVSQNSASITQEIPVIKVQEEKQTPNPPERVIEQISNNSSQQVQDDQYEVVTEEEIEQEVLNKEIPSDNGIYEVSIDSIVPNPDQPRTNFKKDELDELANSIKREGLIQPILVRETEDGNYQIIAGERRWQASKLAGLDKIPINIKEADDDKALELALIENLQRSDLNPIEEAYGYRRLMERRRMTQADVAQAMSKGRSTIANALRLLELPEDAQQLLFEDKITAGHARAILSISTKEGRESLTKKLQEEKLSVREAESMARLLDNKPTKAKKREPIPATYKSVAKALKEVLNTNVKVKSTKGKNKIEIEFIDERDLERIFEEIVGEEA